MVDFEAERNRIVDGDTMDIPEANDELRRLALEDEIGICKWMSRAPKRKSVPLWSNPMECWLLALRPKWRAYKSFGVGFKPDFKNTSFIKLFRCFLLLLRRCGLSPVSWHHSQSCSLNKNNGKEGVAGLRLFHMLDPVGKASLTT